MSRFNEIFSNCLKVIKKKMLWWKKHYKGSVLKKYMLKIAKFPDNNVGNVIEKVVEIQTIPVAIQYAVASRNPISEIVETFILICFYRANVSRSHSTSPTIFEYIMNHSWKSYRNLYFFSSDNYVHNCKFSW